MALELTQKQESFCISYMETGNATESYRRCYDCKNSGDATINRMAKELLDNHKITARLTELRAPAIKNAQITLETHLNDLKTLRDKADAAEKYGPAIQAEVARGKASGLYVEKSEVEHSGGLTVEIIRYGTNPAPE